MQSPKNKILSELNTLRRSMIEYYQDTRQLTVHNWVDDVDKILKIVANEIN